MTAQKTPISKSWPAAVNGMVTDISQLVGKSIPASIVSVDDTNTIVTVQFDIAPDDPNDPPMPQITCAVAVPQWIRWPIQVGDKGVVFSSDYYIACQSGLGDGASSFDQMPNLTNLVWVPLGNTGFGSPLHKNAVDLNGPDGAVMRSTGDESTGIQVVALKSSGFQIKWKGVPFLTIAENGISIQFEGNGIVINELGTFIDGEPTPFLVHTHTDVEPGGGNTGGVTP